MDLFVILTEHRHFDMAVALQTVGAEALVAQKTPSGLPEGESVC